MTIDTSYDKFEKVVYNGFEFPWGTKYRLFGSPVYDDANRVIRYWEYTLTADFLGEFDDLEAEDSPDGKLEYIPFQVRGALEQPGRTLRIKGLYFGNVEINSFVPIVSREADVRYIPDLQFGPRPSLITFELESGPHISTIIWECKFYTHSCIENDALVTLPMFTSFTTEVDFDVRDGLVRRMTIYEIHIPNAHYSEDEYWRALLSPDDYHWVADRLPVPEGFRRRINRKVSKDFLSIQYRILDEEIPSNQAFAPYLIDVRAPYSVSSRLIGSGGNGLEPQGFSLWLCQLTFECGVKKYADKRHAALAFYSLLGKKYAATRVRAAIDFIKRSKTDGQLHVKNKPGRPTLLELELGNDSYSLDFSGRAVWIVESSPSTYLEDTMFFEEEDRKWSDWLLSMSTVHRAIGLSGLKVAATDHAIIDACNSTNLGTVSGSGEAVPIVKPSIYGVTPCPPYRIIAFRPEYKVEEATGTVQLSPNVTPNEQKKDDSNKQTDAAQSTSTVVSPKLQLVAQSEYILEFSGHVSSTTEAPSVPGVIKYQGAEAFRIGRPQIKRVPINGVGKCVIWRTEWRIRYLLDKAPDEKAPTELDGPRFEDDPESPPVDGTGEGGGGGDDPEAG